MSGNLVNLNERIFYIYESTANTGTSTVTDLSDINTTYKPITISASLTAVASAPHTLNIPDAYTSVTAGTGVYKTSFFATTLISSPVKVSIMQNYTSIDGTTTISGNSNKFTVFELYDYITVLLEKFNNGMSYVQRCDTYTKLNTDVKGANPPQLFFGQGNYTNAVTSCDMFYDTVNASSNNMPGTSTSTPYFTNMPGNGGAQAVVFNNSLYDNNFLKTIPNWKTGTVTANPTFSPNAPLINTTKPLLQQLADLINLTQNLQVILETYRGTNAHPNYMYDVNQNKILLNQPDFNYGFELTGLHGDVVNLRSQLDNKVAVIMAQQTSVLYQSQLMKDSAIYANLMWTILATSLIYYVFIKL